MSVALWHHADDQYATAAPAEVTVELHHLPFPAAQARVRHWRIDHTHSNAYTVWQEMGRPQDPTPEQLDRLRERQGLEEGEPLRVTHTGTGGEGQVALRLPLHALSLLEVTEGLGRGT